MQENLLTQKFTGKKAQENALITLKEAGFKNVGEVAFSKGETGTIIGMTSIADDKALRGPLTLFDKRLKPAVKVRSFRVEDGAFEVKLIENEWFQSDFLTTLDPACAYLINVSSIMVGHNYIDISTDLNRTLIGIFDRIAPGLEGVENIAHISYTRVPAGRMLTRVTSSGQEALTGNLALLDPHLEGVTACGALFFDEFGRVTTITSPFSEAAIGGSLKAFMPVLASEKKVVQVEVAYDGGERYLSSIDVAGVLSEKFLQATVPQLIGIKGISHLSFYDNGQVSSIESHNGPLSGDMSHLHAALADIPSVTGVYFFDGEVKSASYELVGDDKTDNDMVEHATIEFSTEV